LVIAFLLIVPLLYFCPVAAKNERRSAQLSLHRTGVSSFLIGVRTCAPLSAAVVFVQLSFLSLFYEL